MRHVEHQAGIFNAKACQIANIMKKTIHIFACFILLFSVKARAQADSTLVEKYLLDFSVPDMPAFKALGTDPSNLLRPSDVKKFAIMISPFYSNKQGVIPKNFALETAPWKLKSKHWTLDEYNNSPWKRFLYNSSFSLGTVNDSLQFSSRIALGYRVSILSKKADIMRAKEVRDSIYSHMQAAQAALTNLQNDWVINVIKASPAERFTYYQDHVDEFNTFLSTIRKYLKQHSDTAMQQHFDELVSVISPDEEIKDKELENVIATIGKGIDDFIADYKKNNWNATRFDIATAWVGQSDDSLLSKTKFSSFSLWATWALAIHKGGQLLVGFNSTIPRYENPDSSKMNITGNLRYYIGTQDFRGFLETQYKYRKLAVNQTNLLLNLGAELRLSESFWVTASAGLDNYLDTPNPVNKLVSSIDLRYSFNKPRK